MQTVNSLWSKIRRLKMRFPAGQGGFTLIELLVVVSILGILAAVVTVNVARFAGRGQESANEAEWDNVQLAIDSLMTENSALAVQANLTNAVSNFGGTGGGGTPILVIPTPVYLYPEFIRQETTKMGYCWNADGEVLAQKEITEENPTPGCTLP